MAINPESLRLRWHSPAPAPRRTCATCAFRLEWTEPLRGWLACDLDPQAAEVFYTPAACCGAYTPEELDE